MPETIQSMLKVLAWQGAIGGHSASIEKGIVPLHFPLSIEKGCIKQRGLKPVIPWMQAQPEQALLRATSKHDSVSNGLGLGQIGLSS